MEQIICFFCRRPVDFLKATFEYGKAYHDHCYRMEKGRELAHLDKKAQLGTITLAESNLMKDLQFSIDLSRQDDKNSFSKKDPYRFCKNPGFGFLDSSNVVQLGYGDFKTKDYIKLPKMRLDFSRSVLEENEKKLNLLRGQRWGWECFNKLENQLLLESQEDIKKLDGKIEP